MVLKRIDSRSLPMEHIRAITEKPDFDKRAEGLTSKLITLASVSRPSM
jgi:hypothetical protein